KTSVERTAQLRQVSSAIPLWVSESKHGMTMPELIARTGWRESDLSKEIKPPLAQLADWIVAEAFVKGLIDRVRVSLAAFHKKSPLVAGLAKEDIRSREGVPAALFDAALASAKDVMAEGDLLRLTSHKVSLKQDEEDAVRNIEDLFRQGGLAVPALSEVLSKSGVDPSRARNLLQLLLKQGKLVRVGADLVYHADGIAQLRAALAGKAGQRFSVPEFKDWTGVSRKYAIPLLEFLDQQRVTRRDGDSRIVL
ncbi:MAG: SelB C-terminal domain-containing protein, partial [Bryobacteraceae bacterium]